MKFIYHILLIGVLIGSTSCDRETQPVVIQTSLDTTLYPGNFLDYVFPTFGQNTNTLKNALIEDYSGHKCGNCPRAHETAADLEANNPGRVFSVTIHASHVTGGSSNLQKAEASGMYSRDFTTTEGKEMASGFAQLDVGVDYIPSGSVNRHAEGGHFIVPYADWGNKVTAELASDLEVNLQAESNYFESTRGLYLHVETEFLKAMEGQFNIVVYAVENEITDWQTDYLLIPNADVEDYKHHNLHIGNAFGETWGRSVAAGSIEAGRKIRTDFSYEVPVGLDTDKMHFLIYVYNRETYEVMQVIKHEY